MGLDGDVAEQDGFGQHAGVIKMGLPFFAAWMSLSQEAIIAGFSRQTSHSEARTGFVFFGY
jgi:hypothetical protein